MENNIAEVKQYIYVNFTPQDKQKAIGYYCSMTGADLETAGHEVEKIYIQRNMDGRELPMPKEWTPSGQQYEKGKRLFGSGRLLLVFTILITVGFGIAIVFSVQKTVNEVSPKEREEWLDKGFHAFRTDGGVMKLVKNYDTSYDNPSDWRSLYVFQPEQEGDLYFGVLSVDWWFHYDDGYAKGLEFFYTDAGRIEQVELEDDTACEMVIVPVENVVVGYGIASEDALYMQIIAIAVSVVMGIIMAIGCILMMVFGKKKMKSNEIELSMYLCKKENTDK